MKKYSLTFLFATLSLTISIIVIILFFYKVGPNSIVDLGTFVGVSTAILGILITLLIVYEIYIAVDIRQKLSSIDKLNDEFQIKALEIESMKIEHNEGIHIMQARISATRQMQYPNGFIKFNKAILYSLDVDHSEEGYGWLTDELEEYILLIDGGFFSGTKEDVNNQVNDYISYSIEDTKAIRAHKNFYLIRDRYNRCIDAFFKRMDKIKKSESVSRTDIYRDV